MQSSSRAELCVIGAGAASLGVLVFGVRGTSSFVLMVAGLGGSVAAARQVHLSGVVPRSLWPTVSVLAISAVVVGPISSHDLWSYSFYGRMVSEHGVDPYASVPAMFPQDVVFPVVRWRGTPSGYGPLFTALSAAVTWVAGDSLLVMRLGFQALAAVSVLWCLSVVARARRHAALTLVALQPFVWVSMVNGGHNDAIVAAILLAAVVALDRDRILRCAALVSVALLVKLTAAFVVVPLVGVMVARRRWRDALTLAVVPATLVLASAWLVPGSLTNASATARGIISRSSIWHPVQLLTDMPGAMATSMATVVVLVLVMLIAWRRRHDASASAGAGASLSVFGMVSSYTLPWYLFLGVPALALSGDLVLLGIVSARATLMAASYQFGRSAPLGVLDVSNTIAAAVFTAAFVWQALGRSAGGDLDGDVGDDVRRVGPDQSPSTARAEVLAPITY